MLGRQIVVRRACLWSMNNLLESNTLFVYSPALLHNAAATLSSLATLSLSGSPPPPGAPHAVTSFTSASGMMASSRGPKVEAKDDDVVPEETSAASAARAELNGAGISVTKSGKKRGTIFKCESCSKVSLPTLYLSCRRQYTRSFLDTLMILHPFSTMTL